MSVLVYRGHDLLVTDASLLGRDHEIVGPSLAEEQRHDADLFSPGEDIGEPYAVAWHNSIL